MTYTSRGKAHCPFKMVSEVKAINHKAKDLRILSQTRKKSYKCCLSQHKTFMIHYSKDFFI